MSRHSSPKPSPPCLTLSTSTTTVISGNSGSPATPRCRKKFDATTHPFPRFGRFARVDINPATANHTKGATSVRTDCASATVCTGEQGTPTAKNCVCQWSRDWVRKMARKPSSSRSLLWTCPTRSFLYSVQTLERIWMLTSLQFQKRYFSYSQSL